MFNRFFLLLSLVGALAVNGVWLLSCIGQEEGEGLVLTIGETSFYTLDPHFTSTLSEDRVLVNLFERLFFMDKWGDLRSNLVSFYTLSPSRKEYTFQLNEWFWSDGSSLTCQDIEFSLQRVPQNFPLIKEVECKDSQTLLIVIKEVSPFFLRSLVYLSASIVPKELVEQKQSQWTHAHHILTSGAYQVKSYREQAYLELESNPFHPRYGSCNPVHIHFIPDDQTAYAMFKNHELLWLPARFSPDWIDPKALLTEDIFPKTLQLFPLFSSYFYLFNLNTGAHPLLQDLNFRKALLYSIDRNALVKNLTLLDVPARSVIPELNFKDRQFYAFQKDPLFDKEKAQEHLARSEHALYEGRKVQLSYNTQDLHKLVAQFVQEQWKKHLGVDVELVNTEWKHFLQQRTLGRYDIARMTWYGEYLDPLAFLDLFTSEAKHNYVGYRNQDYDALVGDIHKFTSSFERQAERDTKINYAKRLLLTDAAVIPLLHPQGVHWVQGVENFYVNPLGLVFYHTLEVLAT